MECVYFTARYRILFSALSLSQSARGKLHAFTHAHPKTHPAACADLCFHSPPPPPESRTYPGAGEFPVFAYNDDNNAEREVIHGRWAMLGVNGAWAAENGTGIPWFKAGELCTPDDCTAVADKFPGANGSYKIRIRGRRARQPVSIAPDGAAPLRVLRPAVDAGAHLTHSPLPEARTHRSSYPSLALAAAGVYDLMTNGSYKIRISEAYLVSENTARLPGSSEYVVFRKGGVREGVHRQLDPNLVLGRASAPRRLETPRRFETPRVCDIRCRISYCGSLEQREMDARVARRTRRPLGKPLNTFG